MTHYKLRITPLDVKDIERFDDLLRNYCSTIMRVLEGDGDFVKYHYHYYLVVSGKYNTLRKKMSDLMYTSIEGRERDEKVRPSRMWSFTKLTIEEGETYAVEYVRYMCKDGIPVEIVNAPMDWITKGREEAKNYVKTKKKEVGGEYRKICAHLDSRKDELVVGNKESRELKIINWIIDWYVKDNKKFSKHQIESIFLSYMCRVDNSFKEFVAYNMRESVLRIVKQ